MFYMKHLWFDYSLYVLKRGSARYLLLSVWLNSFVHQSAHLCDCLCVCLQSTCVCKRGYMGNGKLCDPVNPCTVHNGGCHELVNTRPPVSQCHTSLMIQLMVLFTRATNLHSAVTLSEPHRRLMAAVNGVFSPVVLSDPLSIIRFQNKVKVVKKVEQNNI